MNIREQMVEIITKAGNLWEEYYTTGKVPKGMPTNDDVVDQILALERPAYTNQKTESGHDLFWVMITRKEFLDLPLETRRRELQRQTDLFVKHQ